MDINNLAVPLTNINKMMKEIFWQQWVQVLRILETIKINLNNN